MDTELQKAVKNIETTKSEIKSEMDEVKTEVGEIKPDGGQTAGVTQMFSDGVQRVITPNQQMALQVNTTSGIFLSKCYIGICTSILFYEMRFADLIISLLIMSDDYRSGIWEKLLYTEQALRME